MLVQHSSAKSSKLELTLFPRVRLNVLGRNVYYTVLYGLPNHPRFVLPSNSRPNKPSWLIWWTFRVMISLNFEILWYSLIFLATSFNHEVMWIKTPFSKVSPIDWSLCVVLCLLCLTIHILCVFAFQSPPGGVSNWLVPRRPSSMGSSRNQCSRDGETIQVCRWYMESASNTSAAKQAYHILY